MELRFTQAARRHRVGRAHVAYVMNHYAPRETTSRLGDPALEWHGEDSTGRELHIVVVVLDPDSGLVIHVMPTALERH